MFACKGVAGSRPIWPTTASRSKSNDHLWLLGVDAAKDSIYSRLGIKEEGPGYIHFPADDAFGDSYFRQLTAERRELRKRAGQPYTIWVLPEGRRNEALDTFVGALAVRRSLPRSIEVGLEFAISRPPAKTDAKAVEHPSPDTRPARPLRSGEGRQPGSGWLGAKKSWLRG